MITLAALAATLFLILWLTLIVLWFIGRCVWAFLLFCRLERDS